MTLSDLTLNDNNCFVAMQYHTFFLNRTFLIILTDSSLVGIVGNNGMQYRGNDWVTNSFLTGLHGDQNSPLTFIQYDRIQRFNKLDLNGNEILEQDRANFRIWYSDIAEVTQTRKKKWGMTYRCDGKVYVKTVNGDLFEFIILGNQSRELVKDIILSKKYSH